MRKSFFTLLCLIIFQSVSSGQWSFAVGAGIQTNATNINQVKDYFINSHPQPFVSVNPSYNFKQLGHKSHTILKLRDPETDLMMRDFMSVKALYASFHPTVEYEVLYRFSLMAGLHTSFRLAEQKRYSAEDWMPNDKNPASNPMDVALSFGFKGNVNHYFLSVSYLYGLLDIYQVKSFNLDGTIVALPPINYRNIQVSIGYRFGES